MKNGELLKRGARRKEAQASLEMATEEGECIVQYGCHLQLQVKVSILLFLRPGDAEQMEKFSRRLVRVRLCQTCQKYLARQPELVLHSLTC